jgi:hypothetical protein
MLNKLALSKIIDNRIQTLEGQEFQQFCDRLLLILYPSDYTSVRAGGPKGDMKNDGFCFIDRKFFQSHASRGEKIASIKKKIETDLKGCLEKQLDVKEFVYVTNDTLLGEVAAFIDELRNNHKGTKIDTWGPDKLAKKIAELEPSDIEYIIDIPLNTTTQNPYIIQIDSDDLDNGILDDIFQHISKILPEKTVELQLDIVKLRKLSEKIDLNFSQKHGKEVRSLVNDNWRRMMLVQRFIQEQMNIDDNRVVSLLGLIQDKFRFITGQVTIDYRIANMQLFEKIGVGLLPPNKVTNPDYVSNAKAIVLYFFEFCEIGKKTKDELLNLPPTLFDGI